MKETKEFSWWEFALPLLLLGALGIATLIATKSGGFINRDQVKTMTQVDGSKFLASPCSTTPTPAPRTDGRMERLDATRISGLSLHGSVCSESFSLMISPFADFNSQPPQNSLHPQLL